jgi:hypothetical protein
MTDMNGPQNRWMLAIDSAANYLLGVPLLIAPRRTAQWLALPRGGSGFYPRVLGGVLTGIATALAVEQGRNDDSAPAGLGVTGAIAINTLGGGAVASGSARLRLRSFRLRGSTQPIVVVGLVVVSGCDFAR